LYLDLLSGCRVFFGSILIRSLDKTRFYIFVLAFSLLILMGSWFLFTVVFPVDIGLSDEFSFYHHSLPANILFTSFVIAWVRILYLALNGIPAFIMAIFDRWNMNITEMYVV
jgi:hypothetical protein